MRNASTAASKRKSWSSRVAEYEQRGPRQRAISKASCGLAFLAITVPPGALTADLLMEATAYPKAAVQAVDARICGDFLRTGKVPGGAAPTDYSAGTVPCKLPGGDVVLLRVKNLEDQFEAAAKRR